MERIEPRRFSEDEEEVREWANELDRRDMGKQVASWNNSAVCIHNDMKMKKLKMGSVGSDVDRTGVQCERSKVKSMGGAAQKWGDEPCRSALEYYSSAITSLISMFLSSMIK